MSHFYTKDDEILTAPINKTFVELFRGTPEDFQDWVDELRAHVTERWDAMGQPPKSGVRLEDMAAEFERICRVDTTKMLFQDEQTREWDCIIDGSRVSIANNFFPNILKARDTVGADRAVSVYDLFAKPAARSQTLTVLQRCIRDDGFYDFAPIYRPPATFSGDLRREARRFVEQVLIEEQDGTGQRSLWFDASKRMERRTPRINAKELMAFRKRGLVKPHHLQGVDLDNVSGDTLYRIRVYVTGDKATRVLPAIFRHLQLGAGVAPNNFPAAVARYLYHMGTDKCVGQKDIVIYDPSMGFGGRLLGALSLRDRPVHYIGTDPNTENWIADLGISRYEYMERVFRSHVRHGKPFHGTYLCCGSENVAQDKLFKKYKGKVDFVFTSPPYFSAEVYSDEPTQSSNKFKEYDEWRDGFLIPTLKTCATWLKNDRFLAFNIADIHVGVQHYPLEQDTVDALKALGLHYKCKLKMVLSHAPSMKVSRDTGQPTTKNFCLINGKWRKFEPIFVFYKP